MIFVSDIYEVRLITREPHTGVAMYINFSYKIVVLRSQWECGKGCGINQQDILQFKSNMMGVLFK